MTTVWSFPSVETGQHMMRNARKLVSYIPRIFFFGIQMKEIGA